MSWKDTGIGAHVAATDVLEGRRVILNSDGQIEYAGADAVGIGAVRYDAEAGEAAAVSYWNKPGTMMLVAAGAFVPGADVYAAADGKVDALPADPGDYMRIGTAMEAAEEDGDQVEILPLHVGEITTVSV